MLWGRRSSTLLAFLVLMMPVRAGAADGTADDFLQRGIGLRRERRDAEALIQFMHAYELDASPRALAQIALAEAALERWGDAETALARALSLEDPWIERQRGVLRAELAEIDGHLGTLQIAGPDGTEVWIDGVFTATLPALFLRVSAKHLAIELRAPGFRTDRREVDVVPGGIASIKAELEPAPTAVPLPASGKSLVTPFAPSPTHMVITPAVWVAGGLVGAFSLSGIGFLVYAGDRASHYNNNDECGDLAGAPRSVRCASYAQQFHFADAAEMVSFALAGAAAVTLGGLLLSSHESSVRVGALMGPGRGGATATVTF
jgi:hypothetical protein